MMDGFTWALLAWAIGSLLLGAIAVALAALNPVTIAAKVSPE